RTVKTVAKELGIPGWQLYEWRKLYAPRPGAGGPAPLTLEEAVKENGRLRAELIRMREREEALKKSLGILSETPACCAHCSTWHPAVITVGASSGRAPGSART
ncbi:transposase, partial [bacterium]|nr:transposase [bacterium]